MESKLFSALPDSRFDVVYADPPWEYDSNRFYDQGAFDTSVNAEYQYPTLKVEQLAQLDVASISADDCLLFLWAVSPKLPQAIEVGTAWGFKYVTVGFVWDKQNPNPGHYTMSQCELCLIFKRGKIPQPRGARNIRQHVSEKKTKHSRKPDEVRDRIDLMFPQHKKIELFARKKLEPPWTAWGNELD